MKLLDPIGGFFELELKKSDFPYSKTILLNSGRCCFEYILRASKASLVYIPKFTCDVMLEPLTMLNIPYTFYSINENLEIANGINLKQDELLLYTNYFGIKNDYTKRIAQAYGSQIIIDQSQAFYSHPPTEAHVFYSPRKFFGIPDGGCLITNLSLDAQFPVGESYKRALHLLKRIDLGPEASYEDFKTDDNTLTGEPIQQMSKLTLRLLKGIDFETARKIRDSNFEYLHERLKEKNTLKINLDNISGPMVYPYLVDSTGLRKKLIENKVFVPMYWPNVLEWCTENELEYNLATKILPLPIDQRYGTADMDRIIEILNSN